MIIKKFPGKFNNENIVIPGLLNRKQIKEDRLISEYSEYKDIISKII